MVNFAYPPALVRIKRGRDSRGLLHDGSCYSVVVRLYVGAIVGYDELKESRWGIVEADEIKCASVAAAVSDRKVAADALHIDLNVVGVRSAAEEDRPIRSNIRHVGPQRYGVRRCHIQIAVMRYLYKVINAIECERERVARGWSYPSPSKSGSAIHITVIAMAADIRGRVCSVIKRPIAGHPRRMRGKRDVHTKDGRIRKECGGEECCRDAPCSD